MSMPFYVSPEQIIKDKADYARKGIARGRSVVVLQYEGGVLFVAENPSRSLHKVSEIYDRIGFAAVGKYNEFENLRVAGVRLADMRGYAYDRRDVTGRSLANAYAQTLGSIFTETTKPYEVELVVAEVGQVPEGDEIYRLTFDGSVADEHGYLAMGGEADEIAASLGQRWRAGMGLEEALRSAVTALGAVSGNPPRPDQLEVAILDRSRPRRTFRRIPSDRVASLLGVESGAAPVPGVADSPDLPPAGGEGD
ncbi:MAG: proteasome subunit alpha [Candidatus Nanopelagicales bacterium]|jgi:proteasome alpha subunit